MCTLQKSADSIKRLLEDEVILRLLDSIFDEGKKTSISWDFIRKSVQTYVMKEIECIQAQKPRNSQSNSSIVANNKEKKRKVQISSRRSSSLTIVAAAELPTLCIV
jgi:hypothetical protein